MSGKEVQASFARSGWWNVPGGPSSHQLMTNGLRTVSIPVHGSRDLRSGMLRAMLREAGVPHPGKKLAGLTRAGLERAVRSAAK